MRLGEVLEFAFDYSDEPEIIASDTLASVVSTTVTNPTGAGAVPTFATHTIDGSTTVGVWTAVAAGTFRVKQIVLTAGGSRLARLGWLTIGDRV